MAHARRTNEEATRASCAAGSASCRAAREVQQHPRDDGENHVFPSLGRGRPISEGTLNVALRNVGYDGRKHVPHGCECFDAVARAAIRARTRQATTAHQVADPVVANPVVCAYNRAERIDERRA